MTEFGVLSVSVSPEADRVLSHSVSVSPAELQDRDRV